MKKIILTAVGLMVGSAVAQGTAAPATSGGASVVLEQFLVKTVKAADGKVSETLAPVSTVLPGDVIEQRVTVKNNGDAVVRSKAVRLPVPTGMSFLSASLNSPVTYSLDGKTFSGSPTKTVVVDGQTKVVPAELSDYRMVRWQLESLAGHATKVFSARFKVN